MASVTNRPNGHKWISFRAPNGKRQTIRLGKATKRQAFDFRDRIERLLFAKLAKQVPDADTARWLGELDGSYHQKLVACGLVDVRTVATVEGLLVSFEQSLFVGPSTRQNISVVLANLRTYFGPGRPLMSITLHDAVEFREWLETSGGQYGGPLASSTVSRRTRRTKQVFTYAVDEGWLPTSPFRRQCGFSEVNRKKDFAVTRKIFDAILAEVTNLEFRAILALARFGGLRCPSEILPLEWSAVNWDRSVLGVDGVKTDTYRIVPLFPEIVDALNPLWEQAKEGATQIFPRHQITGTGLTKALTLACKRAGVAPWRRPWQNMRATRETELIKEHPLPDVTAWLGHSPTVALKHYAQVSEEEIARAVARKPGTSPGKETQQDVKEQHRQDR